MKPKMFVASSVESLDLAYAVQESLEHQIEVTVWDQGVFALSRTAMASLVGQLDASDFGLFILAPDDVTAIRGHQKQTVRDNVLFELGLFAGRLGIDRCFLIVPRGTDDLHLPTDLLGLQPAMFNPDREDGNLQAALGPACNRVRKEVAKLGRIRRSSKPAEVNSTDQPKPLSSTQADDGKANSAPDTPPADKPDPQSAEAATIRQIATGGAWTLHFDPQRPAGRKAIAFLPNGVVGKGSNKNEYRWDAQGNKLIIINEIGQIQNVFQYIPGLDQFIAVDHPRSVGTRGQMIYRAERFSA